MKEIAKSEKEFGGKYLGLKTAWRDGMMMKNSTMEKWLVENWAD